MTNEELNAKLYEKMFAEQEKYREKLLTMQPEEILEHAYEYAVREDILASLENNELEDSQARALLKYARPLSLVYKEYETGLMNTWKIFGIRLKAQRIRKYKPKRTENNRNGRRSLPLFFSSFYRIM